MSDIYGTWLRVSDTDLHVFSFDEDGAGVEETRVDAGEILEVIQSADETDSIELQHGPDPTDS